MERGEGGEGQPNRIREGCPRAVADEVSTHGYYRNKNWDEKPRDQDFGRVKEGDYVHDVGTGSGW